MPVLPQERQLQVQPTPCTGEPPLLIRRSSFRVWALYILALSLSSARPRLAAPVHLTKHTHANPEPRDQLLGHLLRRFGSVNWAIYRVEDQ